MKIDFTILRSTLGQRIFYLFLVCVLLPIGILALVSFRSVSQELEEQSESRLRQLTRAQVMSVVERLELLNVELQVAAARLLPVGQDEPAISLELTGEGPRERFLGVTLVSARGELPFGLPDLTLDARACLSSGEPLVAVQTAPKDPARIFMARLVDPAAPSPAMLWGEINPLFLWWGPQLTDTMPAAAELCVLSASLTEQLYCPGDTPNLRQQAVAARQAAAGGFTWKRGDSRLLASYRAANLRCRFGLDGMTVIVSLEKSYLLRPLADFKNSFPPIIVASLGLVLLLSIGQIRKRLVPLERLQVGTQRIAAREFSTRVEVDSGDEFEQLADSFNSMADRLGKQFGTLRSMNEIVQAVLSALDREEIVELVLAHFDEVLKCELVSVTLLEESSGDSGRLYLRRPGHDERTRAQGVEIAADGLLPLYENPQMLMVDLVADLPVHLRPMSQPGVGSVAVFPIFVDSQLVSMISAGLSPGTTPNREDLERARQLADQVAVAFSNAGLLEQLQELSRGALMALARSIDAKSHWTAGHSERVTRMAEVVGRVMGLSAEDLDILHRGGLLHDLGKIGISSEILDKPGRLTDAEMDVVRSHPEVGARILEPIAQMKPLLPLVLEHHEWFNGEGYPEGLAGEQINPLARVLAVADVYDALSSPRPYRDALEHDVVLQMITTATGTQFEPQVVEAFLESEAWRARGKAS